MIIDYISDQSEGLKVAYTIMERACRIMPQTTMLEVSKKELLITREKAYE